MSVVKPKRETSRRMRTGEGTTGLVVQRYSQGATNCVRGEISDVQTIERWQQVRSIAGCSSSSGAYRRTQKLAQPQLEMQAGTAFISAGPKGRHNENINPHENRRPADYLCRVSAWRHRRTCIPQGAPRFAGAKRNREGQGSEKTLLCAQLVGDLNWQVRRRDQDRDLAERQMTQANKAQARRARA